MIGEPGMHCYYIEHIIFCYLRESPRYVAKDGRTSDSLASTWDRTLMSCMYFYMLFGFSLLCQIILETPEHKFKKLRKVTGKMSEGLSRTWLMIRCLHFHLQLVLRINTNVGVDIGRHGF